MSTEPEPQQPRINVRVPKGSDLRRRLDAAVQKTGMDEPTLILRCVEAAVDYIEAHGEITLPLLVTPRRNASEREVSQASASHPSKEDIARAAKLAREVNKGRKKEAARSRSRKRAA